MTRIVVTGADGQLGTELVRSLRRLGQVLETTIADTDLTDPRSTGHLVSLRPTWIVHAAAATDVDRCEREPAWAYAVNAEGTARVVEACHQTGAGLVYISTDYVFDGTKRTPYTEADAPAPLNVYGRSKLLGEEHTRTLPSRWMILRTAWLYGLHGKNFVKAILGKADAGDTMRVVDDQVGCPTYAPDLAEAVRVALTHGLTGTFHLTNAGACSWYEFAREILLLAAHPLDRLSPMSSGSLDRPARRPALSVLESPAWRAAGLAPLRPWRDALRDMLAALGRMPASSDQAAT